MPNSNVSESSSTTGLPVLRSEAERFPASVPFIAVFDEWLSLKPNLTPNSRTVYERMRPYIEWFRDRPPTPTLIEECLTHFKAMGKHDSVGFNKLHMVYRYGIRKGYFISSPFLGKRLKPSKTHTWKPVHHDYWFKVAAGLKGSWMYIPWVMCYETGMACADVCNLRWDMVDMVAGTISGKRHKMRNRDGGNFCTQVDPGGLSWPLLTAMRDSLRKKGVKASDKEKTYVFPRLVGNTSMVGACTHRQREMGFAQEQVATLHDLRRTRITAMVNSGIPLNVVMAVSGHSSHAQLLAYVGVDPSVIRNSVVASVQFSRVCQNQHPPLSSAPIALQTSFTSASRASAPSLETKSPSSSPTTTPSEQERLRAFLIERAARLSRAGEEGRTARETGRLSSMDAYGADQPEPMSSSSSASDSSPSGKDSKPPF